MTNKHLKSIIVIEKDDVLIDAGANFGLFSIFSSHIIGKEGKIYSFELVERTKEFLEKNIKNNNIDNCIVVKKALGESNKEVDIFINDKNLEESSLVINNLLRRKEKIKQIKLDDFIKDNNIQKVDFIKADIEGAERNMLRGAEKTIKKFKPKIAICTYHLPDEPEVIENILKEFVPEYKIVHRYKKIYAYI
jgi:FkbM family methyltransferase